MINQNLTLFQTFLFVANYTGISKQEFFTWTSDEISEAIKFINEQKKLDSEIHFSKVLSSIDYHILATREYQKMSGKEVVADKEAIKEAQVSMEEIRENLTGVKPIKDKPKKKNWSLFGLFAGYQPLFEKPKT